MKLRARQLAWVRDFFAGRDVLEVETPVLGRCGVTEVNIDCIGAASAAIAGRSPGGWLQTSPEYHMKRLLAAGAGAIWQNVKVFRDGERGRRHNPEFSLLEWYRPGFDDQALMDEVADLVCGWLSVPAPVRLSYREAMIRFAQLDPFTISADELIARCEPWVGRDVAETLPRDACLDLVMSYRVEPALATMPPVFICEYPASQAALARLSVVDGFTVAHRFELYVQGIELCNGYWELTDPVEQKARFEADNRQRRALGKIEMPVDTALLDALEAGLPECAGVALGLDRLLMLKAGVTEIAEVLTFPFERA